jgi:hypothetical protein
MPVHQAATTRRLQVTRRRAAVLVAMLLALLVGCSRAQPNEVTFKTSGSEGRVGDIVVTDAMFNFRGPLQTSAVYQPGDTATLRVTIVNEGDFSDRLVSVSSPIAGVGAIDGDAAIPSRHALTAGYTKQMASLTLPATTSTDLKLTNLKTAIRPGLTYPVVFTFARAGQLQLLLQVDTPDRPREDCPLPPNGQPPRVFTAPVDQASVPPLPPLPGCSSIHEQQPRLLRVSAQIDERDDKYDEVALRFLPGSEVPLTSIEQSDDGKVRLPNSNDTVKLAGDQALRVTVSPALLGDPALMGDIGPLPDLPSIAEVRVLGSSEGKTVLGIGVKGEGELAPKAANTEDQAIIRIKHPPHPPADKSECGSILLARPENRTASEASSIEATGASCDAAREVAAFARDQVGKPYATPTGYSCQIKKQEQGETVIVEYLCSRGQEQVSFTVS